MKLEAVCLVMRNPCVFPADTSLRPNIPAEWSVVYFYLFVKRQCSFAISISLLVLSTLNWLNQNCARKRMMQLGSFSVRATSLQFVILTWQSGVLLLICYIRLNDAAPLQYIIAMASATPNQINIHCSWSKQLTFSLSCRKLSDAE